MQDLSVVPSRYESKAWKDYLGSHYTGFLCFAQPDQDPFGISRLEKKDPAGTGESNDFGLTPPVSCRSEHGGNESNSPSLTIHRIAGASSNCPYSGHDRKSPAAARRCGRPALNKLLTFPGAHSIIS
jgi:hypothetical protein